MYAMQDIDNALQVLCSFSIDISELPPDCRDLVPRAIGRCLPYCSVRFLVYKIINLSMLGFSWSQLPDDVQQGVYAAIIRLHKSLRPLGVSSLLWFLSKLGVSLDSVPSDVSSALFSSLRRSLPKMNSIDLTMAVMGLSAGGISWRLLSPSLRW